MQEILLEIRYFERILLKTFKKLTLFFLLNPSLLMNKVIKSEIGLEPVTSRCSGYETSSEKVLYWLYII